MAGSAAPQADLSAVGFHERLALAAVLALAVGLRVWGWSLLGIDQFDEGVYAFTGLGWSDPGQPMRSYPDQILFAPPVFPFLVSLFFRVFGPAATVAIAVNVVLGSLTVLALGLIGRRWFGPAAGVGAALLLAVDPLHVMLSRSALTDVAFLLFFLLALAAVAEAFQRRSWYWAAAAGLGAGIAWNTKYHGWFVLLIAGWGLLASIWESRRSRSDIVQLCLLWGVMAGVASVCYLPWALHVQADIGYRALLDYQNTNVSGTWTANLMRQAGQQGFLETPWSRLGPALAAAAVLYALRRTIDARAVLIVGGLLVLGFAVGQTAITLLLLLTVLAVGVREGAPIPVWLLAGWTALWLASAPLYDPYARLLLPLGAASALGSAWLLSRWLTGGAWAEAAEPGERSSATEAERTGTLGGRWGAGALVALVLLGVVASSAREQFRPQGLWRPGNAMETAAHDLALRIPVGERVIVLGEPELAFYLHGLGRPSFERRDAPEEIAAVDETVFVVVGRYVRSAQFLRDNILGALADRLERIDAVPVVPRDLRLLDDLAPSRAVRYLSQPDDQFDVVLYRLHPGPRS